MELLATRNKPHKKCGWLSDDWWAAPFMMCSTSWVAVGSFCNIFPSEIPFTFIPSNRFLMHKEKQAGGSIWFLETLFKKLLPSPRCHWQETASEGGWGWLKYSQMSELPATPKSKRWSDQGQTIPCVCPRRVGIHPGLQWSLPPVLQTEKHGKITGKQRKNWKIPAQMYVWVLKGASQHWNIGALFCCRVGVGFLHKSFLLIFWTL